MRHAYLNNESCQSLLFQSAAVNLDIDINFCGEIPISGYRKTKEINYSPVFSLKIKPYLSDKTSILANEVLVIPELNLYSVNTIQLNTLCKKFEHLKHKSFPNVDDNKVSRIIGIDNLQLIHYRKKIKGPKKTRPVP